MSAAEPDAIGLCARCRHARIVETPRSRFWLCDKSRYDAAFPRYPRLPVLTCAGHEPGTPVPMREATEGGGSERSEG